MESAISEIKICEVCGNHDLHSVLDLGSHPMCDDLVGVDDPRKCKEYPIEILFCKNCITGHQRFQVPKKDLFPPILSLPFSLYSRCFEWNDESCRNMRRFIRLFKWKKGTRHWM